MSVEHPSESAGASSAIGAPPTPPSPSSRSARYVVAVLVAILAAAGIGVFVVAVLPRWWAHRVGAAADGSFSTAIWLGLGVGLIGTAVALWLLGMALGRNHDADRHDEDDHHDHDHHHGHDGKKRPRRWGGRRLRTRVVYLALALLVAAPNLLTLGIEVGNGNAAHAGDRTLDVEAPGFRGASAVGALVGLVLVFTLAWLVRGRRSRGEELRKVRAELEQAKAAGRD